MLLKVWKNKGKILEGIKNRIFKQEHVEEIFEERLAICQKCIEYDLEGKNCYVPGTQPCCGECGCSLALKLRSLSSECGLDRWDATLTEEEEDRLNEQLQDKQ
jgi:hypothetical protein